MHRDSESRAISDNTGKSVNIRTDGKFDLRNLCHAEEIKLGYLEHDKAADLILGNKGLSFIDNGRKSKLLGQTGEGAAFVKVVSNVGISSVAQIEQEKQKIEKLISLKYPPDMVFDHTRKGVIPIKNYDDHLYAFMAKNYSSAVVIAAAPAMLVFNEKTGIDKFELLEVIEHMACCGVRLMLFHPTSAVELWEIAKKNRKIPSTSWTGTLLYRDVIINKRRTNIIADIFDDILKILKKYNVTCDIGTVFRPARISEALDTVHMLEMQAQEMWIQKAKDAGVFCIREGLGHIALNKVPEFSKIIGNSTPLMPLPVSTDAAVGFDHVACCIAMTAICTHCNVGLLNPVTDIEHIGGIPSFEDIDIALKTARTVAHSFDLTRFPQKRQLDDKISDVRQTSSTCIVSGGLFQDENSMAGNVGVDCNRCDEGCPLKVKA